MIALRIHDEGDRPPGLLERRGEALGLANMHGLVLSAVEEQHRRQRLAYVVYRAKLPQPFLREKAKGERVVEGLALLHRNEVCRRTFGKNECRRKAVVLHG